MSHITKQGKNALAVVPKGFLNGPRENDVVPHSEHGDVRLRGMGASGTNRRHSRQGRSLSPPPPLLLRSDEATRETHPRKDHPGGLRSTRARNCFSLNLGLSEEEECANCFTFCHAFWVRSSSRESMPLIVSL